MSGLFTGNSKKLDQQIAQKIKEATSLLEELKKAILLFPTYNAGFFNMIEDLKKQTSYFEQYKQQDSSRFTTTAKQQLLQQLQENINSINKTIKDVKKKADVERGQQAIQSESEWVQEVIALNESPDDKHNKTVDDHIKQLTELQPHEEQLFFKHYSVIANFLEKKLKKSGAEKVLTQKKELLIQNLLSIPKEQKNNQFNAYIQYLKALQQEANRIINTEADAIRVIRELEKQLKQINPTLLNTYQETLKNQLKQLMISKKPEAQINVEQEKLMDDYEQKLKSAIQKMQPQQASTTKSNTNSTTKIQQALIQQIEDLDANMLSSLENNKTINKDDYDTLLNLISTLENNCEDVTSIMQSLKKLAYQGKIPTWAQQTHDMPSLEKLTNNDIDYLFSYASELVTQLNPKQQEAILRYIKYQLEDQLRKINPDLLAAYQKGLAEGLKVLSEDKKHDTKIGDKAVDLILGYTEILRKVINEQRLERLKILDDQLVQDLINLRLFIRTLPTYDFFRAQNIYKLITKQLHAISDKDMTAEEQLNKKKELIKSIASVTKAYQQHNTQHTTDQSYFSPSTDFNKPLEKLSELPISEFKSHFKNIVYKLEETLERFGKEASALLAEHKQRLFTKLLSADTESEKQILIDYLITLRTEILKLIENEPLGKSQETLPNSLPGAQSQQDLSTRNTGLDSSSMSMNTTPTSPIAPSSARSSRSAELTATPQPISDSSIKHASKSPLASTLFTTIQAPKLFEPEETKLEQQTASTLKNLLSDRDTAKSHYHEKAHQFHKYEHHPPQAKQSGLCHL